MFIAEGPKLVEELLASSFRIQRIYATENWIAPASVQGEIRRVTEDELQRLSALQTANQVLAVVEQQEPSDPVLKGRLSLVLDGIQDPGNLGTIIRIADWFGITQIFAGEQSADLYNPKVIQSTMGSFVRVNVYYTDIVGILENAGLPVFGALLNGENVFEKGRIEEGLLVIGNESRGISEAVKQLVDHPLTIPRYGGAESLNAAVATGIILSHIV